LQLEFDTVSADLLNVIPPQKAGRIAETAGLITANNRWCGVHWQSMESVAQAGIHVLGDATLAAPAMPKSGHMANQHGKVCAAAVIDLLAGRAINADPLMVNTCYSFVDGREVIHVSSVHRFDAEKKTMQAVKDSGGVSAMASELEGQYAWSWAHNIWNDMLT
jgi:sulfite dehydrogenase